MHLPMGWLPLCFICLACTAPPAPPPSRAQAVAPSVALSQVERAEDAAWLASFGLRAPAGGILLPDPFRSPLTSASFIVPTAWYRAEPPRTFDPAALAEDLELLEIAFSHVYGGYEKAQARGFHFDRWFARWKERLRAAGKGAMPGADAFAPMAELMAVQIDNHTGPILDPYIQFGSFSRTALLPGMPEAPCTRMRSTSGAEIDLDPRDLAEQPRPALLFDGARIRPATYAVFPQKRGEPAALLCGSSWMKPIASERRPLSEQRADMLALLGRKGGEEDTPAYAMLAPDVGYLRLPTFGTETGERLRELADALPESAGHERALVIDLRFNEGGGAVAAFPVLERWVDTGALTGVMSKRTEKNSCLVDSLQWGAAQLQMARMEPPISDVLRATLQNMLDRVLRAPERGCPVSVERFAPNWSHTDRRFRPGPGRPVLLLLVNEECASDCEYLTERLASRPETVIAGVNTAGVAEFIQPSFMILPRTRVMFRLARGTSDTYGDGRSFDGHGLDVDILLMSRRAHTKQALVELARVLVQKRTLE